MEPKSIFDLVTLGAAYMYIEQVQNVREPYLGEALFPARKKQGLTLEWIKGINSVPVALQPSAFDAKPLLRERRDIELRNVEMPFFRESCRFGEMDRQRLMTFLESRSGQPYANEIIQRLFDDLAQLVEGAMIDPEIMRMGMLVNGTFTIASPNDSGQYVNIDYNYDPNNTWRNRNIITPTVPWSNHATSTPVQDILALKRAARERGHAITRMIIGLDTWNDLMANDAARADFLNPLYVDSKILTESEWMGYYSSKLGLTIVIYEKIYCPPGTPANDTINNALPFYPQRGNATFLTDAVPGYTWYGTTPEEADLQNSISDAEVRIINTGVAIGRKIESLPVNVINWVSQIVLPSFENMDTVYNIKYTAA